MPIFGQSPKEYSYRDVYQSNNLLVIQIAPNSYQHISYLQTNDFGNVPCNGLVVQDKDEVIIFDTPTNDKAAEELIQWIENELGAKIKAIIPTHFHNDCLGSLGSFHSLKIPSYGNIHTIALAKANNLIYPQKGFKDSLKLKLGNTYSMVYFLGEGHTKDNIVGYFPNENILFGGCLIKELEASKGYLGDANVIEWSNTVEKIKVQFPNVKIVIPGHGKIGGIELLDYTIKLFKTQ